MKKFPKRRAREFYTRLIEMNLPRKNKKEFMNTFSGLSNILLGYRDITKMAVEDAEEIGLKGNEAAEYIKKSILEYHLTPF